MSLEKNLNTAEQLNTNNEFVKSAEVGPKEAYDASFEDGKEKDAKTLAGELLPKMREEPFTTELPLQTRKLLYDHLRQISGGNTYYQAKGILGLDRLLKSINRQIENVPAHRLLMKGRFDLQDSFSSLIRNYKALTSQLDAGAYNLLSIYRNNLQRGISPSFYDTKISPQNREILQLTGNIEQLPVIVSKAEEKLRAKKYSTEEEKKSLELTISQAPQKMKDLESKLKMAQEQLGNLQIEGEREYYNLIPLYRDGKGLTIEGDKKMEELSSNGLNDKSSYTRHAFLTEKLQNPTIPDNLLIPLIDAKANNKRENTLVARAAYSKAQQEIEDFVNLQKTQSREQVIASTGPTP